MVPFSWQFLAGQENTIHDQNLASEVPNRGKNANYYAIPRPWKFAM